MECPGENPLPEDDVRSNLQRNLMISNAASEFRHSLLDRWLETRNLKNQRKLAK